MPPGRPMLPLPEVVRSIRKTRIHLDLTQADLARALGRPQSFVSKFERGERRLDVIEFLDVARALSLDPMRVIADLERRS